MPLPEFCRYLYKCKDARVTCKARKRYGLCACLVQTPHKRNFRNASRVDSAKKTMKLPSIFSAIAFLWIRTHLYMDSADRQIYDEGSAMFYESKAELVRLACLLWGRLVVPHNNNNSPWSVSQSTAMIADSMLA